jgi:pilus assembly protein Flp/PilA
MAVLWALFALLMPPASNGAKGINMSNIRVFADYVAAKLSITSEKGVTAIEYGLIATLIAVAIIGAVTLVGQKLTNDFNTIANKL